MALSSFFFFFSLELLIAKELCSYTFFFFLFLSIEERICHS